MKGLLSMHSEVAWTQIDALNFRSDYSWTSAPEINTSRWHLAVRFHDYHFCVCISDKGGQLVLQNEGGLDLCGSLCVCLSVVCVRDCRCTPAWVFIYFSPACKCDSGWKGGGFYAIQYCGVNACSTLNKDLKKKSQNSFLCLCGSQIFSSNTTK